MLQPYHYANKVFVGSIVGLHSNSTNARAKTGLYSFIQQDERYPKPKIRTIYQLQKMSTIGGEYYQQIVDESGRSLPSTRVGEHSSVDGACTDDPRGVDAHL